MADSETTPDTRDQVTSKTPRTAPVKEKTPNRVAVGKDVAAKTKQAHEEQKKPQKTP